MADKVLYTITEELVSDKENLVMTSAIDITYEEIPAFEEIRTKLLPLVKTDAWLKTIKDLQQTNSGNQNVFYKPLNNISRIDFGFTVAISYDDDHYQYVLNSYLSEWHISSSTLVQIAQANIRKRLLQQGKSWKHSRTGIRFIDDLGKVKYFHENVKG